jgi:hypothetical protein
MRENGATGWSGTLGWLDGAGGVSHGTPFSSMLREQAYTVQRKQSISVIE